MATRVVTIARTLGAGGELIGRAVADRLGFRFVDEEIIVVAAKKENIDPSVIADVEKRKPFFARLLESFGHGPALEAATLGGMMVDPRLYFPEGLVQDAPGAVDVPEHYRELIRQAILEFANFGDVVIHAHAAGMTLAGRDDVLRVLVTASPDTRIQRLVTGGAKSAKDAEHAIRASDRDRRDYFKRFHQISDEQATDYDLVVNTDILTPEAAATAIVAAARP